MLQYLKVMTRDPTEEKILASKLATFDGESSLDEPVFRFQVY